VRGQSRVPRGELGFAAEKARHPEVVLAQGYRGSRYRGSRFARGMSRFRSYRRSAIADINRPALRPQTRGDFPGGAGFPLSSARLIFKPVGKPISAHPRAPAHPYPACRHRADRKEFLALLNAKEIGITLSEENQSNRPRPSSSTTPRRNISQCETGT
jgi:hypothetical protein